MPDRAKTMPGRALRNIMGVLSIGAMARTAIFCFRPRRRVIADASAASTPGNFCCLSKKMSKKYLQKILSKKEK